jgi:predicted nucleic acid-binding protein
LEWARLRVQLADAGRRLNVNDSWIAATALAHDMPIVTQDDDFDVLSEFSRLVVLKV